MPNRGRAARSTAVLAGVMLRRRLEIEKGREWSSVREAVMRAQRKRSREKGARGSAERGMTVRSLRLQGDSAMGRLVAETGDVLSESSFGREATVG